MSQPHSSRPQDAAPAVRQTGTVAPAGDRGWPNTRQTPHPRNRQHPAAAWVTALRRRVGLTRPPSAASLRGLVGDHHVGHRPPRPRVSHPQTAPAGRPGRPARHRTPCASASTSAPSPQGPYKPGPPTNPGAKTTPASRSLPITHSNLCRRRARTSPLPDHTPTLRVDQPQEGRSRDNHAEEDHVELRQATASSGSQTPSLASMTATTAPPARSRAGRGLSSSGEGSAGATAGTADPRGSRINWQLGHVGAVAIVVWRESAGGTSRMLPLSAYVGG